MLDNILRRLPALGGSHYVEAQREDPEILEVLLDALDEEDEEGEDEAPRWAPSGAEWRQDTELLGRILDQLAALTAMFAAHPIPHGGRRPDIPPPFPRPPRAIEKHKLLRAKARQAELVDEVEEAKARWRALQQQGETPDEGMEPTDN